MSNGQWMSIGRSLNRPAPPVGQWPSKVSGAERIAFLKSFIDKTRESLEQQRRSIAIQESRLLADLAALATWENPDWSHTRDEAGNITFDAPYDVLFVLKYEGAE